MCVCGGLCVLVAAGAFGGAFGVGAAAKELGSSVDGSRDICDKPETTAVKDKDHCTTSGTTAPQNSEAVWGDISPDFSKSKRIINTRRTNALEQVVTAC